MEKTGCRAFEYVTKFGVIVDREKMVFNLGLLTALTVKKPSIE
jgi:hypothetical protein